MDGELKLLLTEIAKYTGMVYSKNRRDGICSPRYGLRNLSYKELRRSTTKEEWS